MKSSTQRIVLLALSIGIAGYALLKFVPTLVDTAAIKAQIEDGLHKSTGVHFRIKALTLEGTLFQGIQAHLNTTAITDIQHHPLGHIENITVQIRYLPLLTRQTPEIAKIHLNHVFIPVGQYSLFKSLKLKLIKPQKTGFLNPAELKDAELLLTDYLVEDRRPAPVSRIDFPGIQRFRIEGKVLSLRHLESRRPLSLQAQGQLAYLGGLPKSFSAPLYRIAPYQLFVEVPQSVTQPKHVFGLTDLSRLKLTLGGPRVPVSFSYRYDPRQQAEAQLKSQGMNLAQAQALVFQLANTLGPPLPTLPYRLTGVVRSDARFHVSVKPETLALRRAQGTLNFRQMALYRLNHLKTPLLNALKGEVRLKGDKIEVHDGALLAQGLPLRFSGGYWLNSQQVRAVLFGRNLNLEAVTDKAIRWGFPASALKGRTVRGGLDLSVYLSGTLSKPQYKGLLVLRNGAFSDAGLGIQAQQLQGRLAFDGQGLTTPSVAYTGRLLIPQGRLASTRQGITVEQFQGNVDFSGKAHPSSGQVSLPDLRGVLAFQKGRYQNPQHPIPVTGLHGTLHLLGQWIQLDDIRGTLGGAVFKAQGRLATSLSQYQLHLTGNDIDIPRLHREVLAKLPEVQPLADVIKPYSGIANLNMTIQTGLQLAGSLDVKSLALQTADANSPLQAPHLALRFKGNTLTLADSTLLYGPLAARVGGTVNTGGVYNLHLNTDPVPVAFVREQQPLLETLSGVDLPEIWNAAGDFSLSGTFSNRQKRLTAQFNQAGLSWAGGDFPLYDLNGGIQYQQQGTGIPTLQSENVTFRYGNSPMSLTVKQDQALQAELKGQLSDLLVNQSLVSPQSNATPYQAMPFKINVNGKLVAWPGQPGSGKNDLESTVFVGLSQNFREAYSGGQSPASGMAQTEGAAAGAGHSSAQSSTPTSSPSQDSAPDILGDASIRDALRNLNAINAANTALGAATNTVDKVRQTVGKSLDVGWSTLKKPGQFITQKLLEKPHESVETQALEPSKLPESFRMEKPPLEALQEDSGRAFLYGQFKLTGNELRLKQANLHLFDGGDIVAEGSLQQLDQPEQSPYRLHLVTVPEINLAGISQGAMQNSFFQGAKGTLGADLTLSGGGENPRQLNGWLAANRLEVPYLTLQDITARLDFAGETANIDVPSFKVPGVTARLTARSENVFEVPVPLEAVSVNGSFVSIESLGEFNNTIVKPILIDQVAHNYLRPWQQGDPTSAVQFRDGDLLVDEVIYQNVILSNLRSKLSLNGNSFLELTDTRLDAAGGQVNGYLSLSPNENSFTTLELNANGVKANALTKALLNVTNQIFGDLSGTVRFTTFGQSDVDMQKNANGTVSLKVTNGRLPAIAKVETLLATANVFRGGVLGLNLNNLFRSLTFYDSNYFAELSGDMLINNQILYTQNLVSDGVNLDLLIQGSLRMDNGNANMLINGRMSQDIAGKLGAFGNLSLGRLLSYVPALGNLGEHRPGLLGYIPGVGYVPGFGGPARKFNRFQVRLVGQPDDPDAIRDFRWIRSQNL
ncbi:AsmA family protein [Vampirovibrio chlorellavorus]|uniref:AsmA family protein n=1 Tax=Vampirovibrio chlorellavorus TaxID=758823 RepID=UPI0026EA64EF|nr:AsmA-like C-terminal region-containing protein [Vampirovibrio chlorellavorus]